MAGLVLMAGCSVAPGCDFRIVSHQADSGLAQKYQFVLEHQLLVTSKANGIPIDVHLISARSDTSDVRGEVFVVSYALTNGSLDERASRQCAGTVDECSIAIKRETMQMCEAAY